ncbi:CCA tRNA nucleotidyltransferase [Geitlerinema sp. P-1104]|uniref:CCA tRNA nucleotidyltransferase n=1 Tax=Geitlerinema sp. P-1104 TaxID=2546230 RepID=UPI0025700C94|nr:CCA tRNA nucleotidyltransferase [Geitlerinema sp. P-1104]
MGNALMGDRGIGHLIMEDLVMGEEKPTVFSPQTWGFSLEDLPPEACLVGGAVRDGLLGRQSDYLDLDFVVPQGAIEAARKLAQTYQAGFVILDATREIARVVFPEMTVDFALQEGDSLEADLRRRDFTVNAIAYNPRSQTLIDPLQGYQDLQQRQLRTIALENLKDDPLRLLRGYRQAAQLGFSLQPETQAGIRQLAPLLTQVAAERVNSELGYLLGSQRGTYWLQQAWQDGLLSGWFPQAQGQSLDRLRAIDEVARELAQTSPQLAQELQAPLRPTLKTTLVMIAKLMSLMSEELTEAETTLAGLKYSRAEVRAVLALQEAWRGAGSEAALRGLPVRSQYFWFKRLDGTFPAYVLYALASGISREAIAPYIQHYLNPNDPIAHPRALLKGQDLIETLGVPRGPEIGYWLTEIAIAQAEGLLNSPHEALDWVKQQRTQQGKG